MKQQQTFFLPVPYLGYKYPKEYIIKGFVLDDELTKKDRHLAKII